MNKVFTLFCAVIVAGSVSAGDFAFVAIQDTDALIKSYPLADAQTRSTNACADVANQLRYRVIVTAAEYEAGWDNLSAARKAAAKTAAATERADIDAKMDKLVKAFALVMLDEVNILRVKAGLSERTAAQLKAAIKAKYEVLP